MNDTTAKEGDLRVWWIPQVPGAPFLSSVESPTEAKKLLDLLARYDAFQLEHRIKPDYSNVGGLEVFEGGEWVEWECPDTWVNIDQWEAPERIASV